MNVLLPLLTTRLMYTTLDQMVYGAIIMVIACMVFVILHGEQ